MQAPAPKDAFLPPLVFVVGFGYLYAFWQLGWFPQDEGVLYYQYLRTLEGQIPYRDFYSGYPPLVYYLHAWLFSVFGVSMHPIRAAMAVVNATSAAALCALALRIAPRPLALIPPALFLVMQPGDITDMAFHNSPYPFWYAVTFASLGAWVMMRFLEAADEARARGWLLAAGVLGGLTFLSKQNAGIFFLWGATGFLASRPDPPAAAEEREPWLGRVARAGYLAAIPLASLYLVKNFLSPVTLGAFVAPPAILAVLGARRAFGAAALGRLAARMACLGAGFAIAFGPWLAYFAAKVGADTFLRGLFFVGTDVDRNLYVPFPAPWIATVTILLPLLAWALISRLAAARGRRPPVLLLPLLGAFVLGAILSQARGIGDALRMQFGLGEICILMSMGIDNLALYVALVVLAAALAVVWRQARGVLREEDPPPDAIFLALWLAATSFLLFYPRMDAAHLAGAAPLLYPVGAALLPRVRAAIVSAFSESRRAVAGRVFGAACLVGVLFVVGVKVAPKLYTLRMLKQTDAGPRIVPTPRAWLGLPRADLYFPVYFDGQGKPIESFRDVVRIIRRRTALGEPIFAFPALPMFYFVSERGNPTRQDYFFGTNVSTREQMDVIRALEKARVSTVVIANNPGDYFVRKGQDFTRMIWEYLRREYYLERRIGPYDVLRRYGAPADATGAAAPGGRRP